MKWIKQLFCTHTYDEPKSHTKGKCLRKKKVEIAYCTKCNHKKKKVTRTPEDHKWKLLSSRAETGFMAMLPGFPIRYRRKTFLCTVCAESYDETISLNGKNE